MVDFSFTEEQDLFREAVREWLSKNLTLEHVRENDTKHEIPRSFIKGLGDLGLILLTLPEEDGGSNADWVTATIGAEELGYADISVATPVFYLVQASWGYVVNKLASETVKERYIRRAAKGNGFIGIGVTEPGGGSDVAGFKTNLKPDKGGGWVVNGEKCYISGTAEATDMDGGYFVSGYTDRAAGHRGMTAVFMPINMEGVEITKRFDNMGRMAISTGGFTMTDVKVPKEYQLGETNRGFYHTMEGFDAARVLVSASCIGAAQRCLEIGMDYIKEREAFGQPLAKYQGIQFDLADMVAHHEAIRSLVYRTAWMLDQRYQHDSFTALEVSKYLGMCKYLAPHHALDTFRRVMYWLGAYGYTKECPLEMGIRGVMSYCIGAEGAANIQKIIIARETLGRDWTRAR
ncbi:MAG: acyl-CoA dehydrogenase family protein [Candidatus Bathyarchaeota archaeon]